ncbi:hypothetical protein [Streptomyces europaeiscabiei]|uniref:hypothetical protein n=1 Tax=Streptomyces europaeiscabiei TaxID=146819 RepID=UPI0029B6A462|nr:hypothetical protein [Streptomyces europaeiscabiei]MDX2766990.1 hypothetical protein [Streptomyces europaeiscabiei]
MTTTVDPRIALMSRLNTPPYDEVAGMRGTPLDEAAQLLDAYRASVLLEAAKALELRFGLTPTTIELRLMSTNAQQAANA